MEAHETDFQRARRQRTEVKKHGITGATPEEAKSRIKKHELARNMKGGKKSWAETHGQEPGKQLKGTITGKKFGPKSY